MMKFATLFLTAVVAATVSSMPTSNPDLQDIAASATQACPAAGGDESQLLSVFHDEMMEAINAINTTLNLNSQWIYVLDPSTQAFCAEVTSNISVPVVDHDGLSDTQNLRLRALLQMANYVHFLKSQDNNTIESTTATTQLRGILNKVNSVVFSLGELLPSVPCENIIVYTEEDVSGHVITAPQAKPSDQRSFCYCVLEFMLGDFRSTLKSVESKTVAA